MKNMLIALALSCGILAIHSCGSAVEPLGWKYQYDEYDRLIRTTDPAGRSTAFKYSGSEKGSPLRLTKTPPEGPSTIWQLDDRSRLVKMSDEMGEVDYGYDELGRLKRVQRKGGPAMTYAYDALDRITRVQIGDFYELVYAYDFLGRMESVKTPAGIVSYEYLTGQGVFVRKLPNGVETHKHYEVNGELQKIVHVGPDHKVMAEFTYHYRPDGLIDSIRERSPRGDYVTQYKYDLMGRLVQTTGPGDKTFRYEYDEMGNRIKAAIPRKAPQECAYDYAGRLTSIDRKTSKHDAAGNLASLPYGEGTRQFSYTTDGQIKSVDGGKVSYGYDGNGYLARRTAEGVETTFIFDPLSPIWQPLVMVKKNDKRTLIVWEGTTPLIIIRDGKPEYLLHDQLGSVRLVADRQGVLNTRLDFSPFGLPEHRTADQVMPGFSGLFWDEHAGVYLTLRRAYDSLLGRFLQPDPQKRVPMLSANDLSLFAYCGGDPVNYVDQDGVERVAISSTKPEIDLKEINLQAIYCNRVDRYIDAWIKKHGPGPVDVFVVGMTLRFEERETYAAEKFSEGRGDRVIVIPSYESLGFFGHKINLPKEGWAGWGWIPRYTEDFFKTVVDRIKPDRNLDLPHVWSRLEAAGCPVVVSYHESGANHDLLKNVPYIIDAAKAGFRIPYLVPTSGSIGASATMALREANVGVHDSISDRNDVVKFIETPAFELGYKTLGWDLRRRRLVADVVASAVGLGQKLWSGTGYAVKELYKNVALVDKFEKSVTLALLSLIPGNRYNTEYHAGPSLYGALREIQDHQHRLYVGTAKHRVASKSPSAFRLSEPKAPELYRRKDLFDSTRYPGWFGGPPPPPPPGGGGAAKSGPTRPSTVGGVYLGGAGRALEGLGLVSGISVDQNNNLILVGQEGKTMQLPPLRMDDVVTIFRSVYLHGEGPSVTIDPVSDKPEESAMVIRHGKATEDTYVGWVLYEADRLMKGYTLGFDNKTGQKVTSGVAGYPDVLNTIFFGGEPLEKRQSQGHWERFWIVPAEARRFDGARKELTLLDVPLKVKTQSMKWQNGALVDDPEGRSSPGALAFTDWFTGRYDLIAGERLLTPPPESGILNAVPVFTELRRIALITAIAEKLRDQSVPMPFWMLDYEVKRVRFEKITPALRVTRSNEKIQTRVFGGVQLSSEKKDVKVFTMGSDLKSLPKKEEWDAVRQKVELATSLEGPVKSTAITAAPLKIEKLSHQGGEFKVVSMPGADTRALGAFRLEEADLSVPLPDSGALSLSRSHNSFFDPQGPWGKGWALDLPRLVELRLPIAKKGNEITYHIIYELTTPLNSIHARFSKTAKVPALNNSELLVPDQEGAFLGLGNDKPDFLTVPTRVLFSNKGSRWHFTEGGLLAAVVDEGLITVYERDQTGRVSHIVGMLARKVVGEICLHYGPEGRLQSAEGKNLKGRLTVSYEYDPAGRLKTVKSSSGRVGYRYEGPWIAVITWQDADANAAAQKEETVRSMEYNSRGQLIRETYGTNDTIDYAYASGPDGVSAMVQGAATKDENQVLRFDPALRPTQAHYSDGTRVSWQYPEKGGMEMEVSVPDQSSVILTQSPDNRLITLKSSEGPAISAEKDEVGRLVSLSENGRPLLRQYWHGDGRLERVESETSAVWQQFDRDGLVSSLIQAPPKEEGSFRRFQEIKLDPAGRPVEIRDHRGLHRTLQYNEAGEIAAWTEKRDGKKYGATVNRDKQGRVQKVKSSWGSEKYDYNQEGSLSRVQLERQGKDAAVEFEAGLVRKLRQFNGGETFVSYYGDGAHAGLPKEMIGPNATPLKYRYDEAARISKVEVGKWCQVILDYDDRGRLVGYAWHPADSAR